MRQGERGESAVCILTTIIRLKPLEDCDREQFIRDNQQAFLYGAAAESGAKDTQFGDGEQIIPRRNIEESIDAENAEAYRVVLGDIKLGGAVIRLEGKDRGCLELLFVTPRAQDCGIGQAAWQAVERLHPEIRVWETVTPCFEKRNIHFYVNRCGFHIVEFFNSRHPDPRNAGETAAGNVDMFRLEKVMP